MNALASAVEIAAALGLSEARASQLVWLARCRAEAPAGRDADAVRCGAHAPAMSLAGQ